MHLRVTLRTILSVALLATLAHAGADDNQALRWTLRTSADAWTAMPSGPLPLSLPGGAGLRYPPWPRPYVVVSPDFDLAAEPFQIVTVAYAASAESALALTWTGQMTGGRNAVGRFIGLPGKINSPSQATTISPYWQDFARIRNLQIAVPPNTPWTLAAASIDNPLNDAAPSRRTSWEAPEALAEWRPLRGLTDVRPVAGGLIATLTADRGELAVPAAGALAVDWAWYGLAATGDGLSQMSLGRACDGAGGLQSDELTVPDAGRHVYNVRLAGTPGWRGSLRGLSVALHGQAGSRVMVHRISLGKLPMGPPDLRCSFFGLIDPLPRAGRPQQLMWVGENLGGEAVDDLQLQISAAMPLPARGCQRLDYGVEQTLTWDLGSFSPGTVTILLTGRARNVQPISRSAPAVITAPVSPLPPVAAVPAAVPLAVLFVAPERPSWQEPDTTRRYLRRPVLGDYAGDDDRAWPWHIRWAATHGIITFIFELRVAGDAAHSLNADDVRAVDAFCRCPKPTEMRWCVRVQCAGRPSATAVEAALAQLGARFGAADYWCLDGKPAVFVARAGNASQGLCDLSTLASKGGRAQPYLVACADPNGLTRAAVAGAGYAAMSDADDEAAMQRRASLNAAVEPLERSWRAAADTGIALIPNLAAGFDAQRPASLPRFAFLCQLARQCAGTTPRPIIVGAWNDITAPLCLEPERGMLFGPLDIVGHVFASMGQHDDPVPADAGEGPFDRPLPQPPSKWNFDTPGFDESWDSAMGFRGFEVTGGAWRGITRSDEAALFGGLTRLDAREFDTVRIRLSVSAGTRARLAWQSNLQPLSPENSVPFAVRPDAQPHEYVLRVGLMPGWRGLITGFRLDPTNSAGAQVALDALKVTHELQ